MPDINEERGCIGAAAAGACGAADGAGCVIDLCIGCAVPGAVFVEGGAEYVLLPRLPEEVLPPTRASARPGARASVSAAVAARK